MTSLPTLALLAAIACPPPSGAALELFDHTLGEGSGAAARADLPRGHLVSFRVTGTPGDRVLLLASTAPPLSPPPLVGGEPLLVDPVTGVVLVNGLVDPSAVIGANGRFDLTLTVAPGLPIGPRLWMQGGTVSAGGALDLSNGLELELVDVHVWEFETGADGWVGDFADYPVGQEEFYELAWDHSPLPPPLDPTQSGMRMHGNNHSDDLFMYLRRQVGGLVPGDTYLVDAEVRVASQYPANALGVGGAPGSGVYLHGGASDVEPLPVPGSPPGWVVMNIAKGNQAMPGAQSAVLGHIGIAGNQFVYTLVERSTPAPVPVIADAAGNVWLHIGTDSAFEATTEVWYDRLEFRIRK